MNLATKVLNKPIGGYVATLPFIDIKKYFYFEYENQEDEEMIGLQNGDFVEIDAGRIALNFYCKKCEDSRTFMSPDRLHALIINENLISIDAFLQCPVCKAEIQVWFLLEVKDMFTEEPKVKILKRTEKLSKNVSELRENSFGIYTDLLEKAMRASREGFGAGAIIYLRKVFEQVTSEAAKASNISTTYINSNGKEKRKNFKDLLTEVDTKCAIVPIEFSNNRYKLFGKLSDVVHGEYDEEIALEKFSAFYRLVTGIIENIKSKEEFQSAQQALGLSEGGDKNE
ncbi:hypothetical protein [uncultured Ruminococcus sp.]|uniref:hypothetical protein n=1 Tax=uncultured Ruminococcus sp. TaxID=165186 RepID=UPI000E51C106|nr:hypothetical protein [Ruminococcus bromii]RGI79283.1 hypothetical protein DXD86_04370 [Ruminococcus bromii]RGI82963.1 hypothetical protein DXD83_03210 [Ruminococcus bromii]RGS76448.1 hypothetical protein DWX71_09615 [Ruminococcus bromii]